jgi:hypothetical protein
MKKWIPVKAVLVGYQEETEVHRHSIVRTNRYGSAPPEFYYRTETKYYAPVVRYEIQDGDLITAKFPVSHKDQNYELGKKYHILYNPRKPEQFTFEGREEALINYEYGDTVLPILMLLLSPLMIFVVNVILTILCDVGGTVEDVLHTLFGWL